MQQPLTVRIVSQRALVYTDTSTDEDRPPHVRAASAIAAHGDTLYVVQDDAGFIARVRGDEVTAIPLPRGPDGRRRFEARLGNKLDKLDLESCVIVDDELWAFGSGTIPMREHVVRMSLRDHALRVAHEPALYASLRAAVGGAINIEGVARVGETLVFFHRGNTSATDRPAIVRVDRDHRVLDCQRVELGAIDGVALGFTDACAIGETIVFIASAEASANAIDDGRVAGNVIGVLGGSRAALVTHGKPEGLALRDDRHAWITVDPDDPDVPTTLYAVELDGIKCSE